MGGLPIVQARVWPTELTQDRKASEHTYDLMTTTSLSQFLFSLCFFVSVYGEAGGELPIQHDLLSMEKTAITEKQEII